MARIVAQEAELGADYSEEKRDRERAPRVTEQEEPTPADAEGGDRRDHLIQ
jgi:hypothetical protein